MTYTNGDKYEGQWVNDKKEGEGTMKYSNGNWYRGKWKNDKPNGLGTRQTDGTTYTESGKTIKQRKRH